MLLNISQWLDGTCNEHLGLFQFAETFLSTCDFMCGSPTALADKDLEDRIKKSVEKSGNGFYVPSGAFWGGEDIRKMADRGTLKVITETSN